ncbi:MAG: GHKL domain-containing protein [Bacteroidetes bacterium]|nr:GHKL domain-containing protein [Bacteroidota bacterium]
MSYKRRLLLFSVLALCFLCTGLSLQLWQENAAQSMEKPAQNAEIALNRLISNLNSTLDQLQQEMEGPRFNDRAFSMKVQHMDLPPLSCILVFEAGNLRFWTENQVLPDSAKISTLEPGKIHFVGNGWYFLQTRAVGDRLLAGLLLVQHQYVLQNKYLNNQFHPALELPENTQFETSPGPVGFSIKDEKSVELFKVSFSKTDIENRCPHFISLLYGSSILFLLLAAFDALRRLGRKRSVWGIILLFGIIIIRFLMASFHWPDALYESDLFSSTFYASGFMLNSLGDLLISVAVASLIIIFTYAWLLQGKRFKEGVFSRMLIILVFYSTFLFSVLINYLLSGLIINSQISFDISNIFQLTIYTGIGMLIIGMLLGTFYLLCDGGVQFIRKTGLKFSNVAILFLISQGIFLTTLLVYREDDLFTDYGVSAFLMANILIFFIGYIRKSELQLYSLSRTALVILVFSLYAAQIIYSFNEIREQQKRQLLAAQLENEQDVVAEFLLQNIELRLRNDKSLIHLLSLSRQIVMNSPNLIEDISRQLTRQYFSGYLGRYEVRFKYFNSSDLPVNRAGDPSWNIDIINNRNLKEGKPVAGNSFYYFSGENGRAEYVGLLKPGGNDAPVGTLVIELRARSSQEENGLPELLLNDKVGRTRDLTNYSYAKYQLGKLVNQSGGYNYYLTEAPYLQYMRNLDGMRFVSFDNHSHLFYRYGRNLIILSTPRQGLWVWVTLFSYLFTFFTFLYIFLDISIRLIREGLRLQLNFNSRIQLTIVLIVIGTLTLIGVATVTYIVDNYEKAQTTRIREKMNNVRVLVESQLRSREELGFSITDDLLYSFRNLSGTLKTDFNLYKPNGILFFSSQPGIYEQEIIAPVMNRTAFTSLTTNQKAHFIQSENIGNLKYIAAYEPVRNAESKAIGFLSLPYFDRDTELKRDISGFLVALINLYVLLFSISILVAFIISNRITQPLRIIQENLKRTTLGSESQPIIWKTKDEIGALIGEYNRMLDQLQKSAGLLARSERESAWREMAKPVAHEIKNPLTPMKLGIQHLQRAMDAKHPNMDELVRKISTTLIEQIDTLSNIATEFSHFAKMPKPEYTRVELKGVLIHACDLYNEAGSATVVFEDRAGELFVQADKDQLIRVFGNLIKNAQQAIPDDRVGVVKLRIEESSNDITVSVEDNGVGIPPDQLGKIFVPNFTTKTSGTGLGLAMVKAMVEGMGGQVWFNTRENEGTTFFLKLIKN